MQRYRTNQTMNPTAFLPERGKAREEHYEPQRKEPFGLNKRTRRQNAGLLVTLPNGEYPKRD